jgi:hypothetical protein
MTPYNKHEMFLGVYFFFLGLEIVLREKYPRLSKLCVLVAGFTVGAIVFSK